MEMVKTTKIGTKTMDENCKDMYNKECKLDDYLNYSGAEKGTC